MQEKNPDSFGGKTKSENFQNLEMSRSCERREATGPGNLGPGKCSFWGMQRPLELKKKQFIADFVTHCSHFCEENEGKKEGREREMEVKERERKSV